LFEREEEESALQASLTTFSHSVKLMATGAALMITFILWVRISIEVWLVMSNSTLVSSEWKHSIQRL